LLGDDGVEVSPEPVQAPSLSNDLQAES
jgi:hypothetical protein